MEVIDLTKYDEIIMVKKSYQSLVTHSGNCAVLVVTDEVFEYESARPEAEKEPRKNG
jgi:hypothetical protein